jgi:hypothetical protein
MTKNTTRDFVNAYHRYEDEHSFNMGAYLSDLFNNYGVEAAIVLGSIFAGIYLLTNGLTVLGIGLPIVVYLFVYLYRSYIDTKNSRGWPPLPEECPNGFYKDTQNQENNMTTCLPLPGYTGETKFQYKEGDYSEGCKIAQGKGYDWDRCGF